MTRYGTGLGSGTADLLTVCGRQRLESVDIVYSPGRLSRGVAAEYIPESKLGDLEFSMTTGPEELQASWKTAAAEVAPRARNSSAAFVTLGNPCIYSMFGHLWWILWTNRSGVDIGVVLTHHQLTVETPNVLEFETPNISNTLVLQQPKLFYISRKLYGVMTHLSILYEEEADWTELESRAIFLRNLNLGSTNHFVEPGLYTGAIETVRPVHQVVAFHRILDHIEVTPEKLGYKQCDRERRISRISGSCQWFSQPDMLDAQRDIEYEQQRSVGRHTQWYQYR